MKRYRYGIGIVLSYGSETSLECWRVVGGGRQEGQTLREQGHE